jgi:uncharacterized protein DUF4236
MPLSWRKGVRLAPGVRMTFSKRGASVSAGPRGAKAGVDTGGRRRVGLSAFGFLWRKSRRGGRG